MSHTRVVLKGTLLVGSLELSLGSSGGNLDQRNTLSDLN